MKIRDNMDILYEERRCVRVTKVPKMERLGPSVQSDVDPNLAVQVELIHLQAALDALAGKLYGALGHITTGEGGERVTAAMAPPLTASFLKRIIKARQMRGDFLAPDLFADPAWDILLEAYLAELTQKRVSISCVGHVTAVPATTVLRWIAKLEEDGWVRKLDDPMDARRKWLELTPRGSSAMARYFSSISLGIVPI